MSDFADRLTEILNHGALNLAMAIGYQHHIFDRLEDLNRPVTVGEMAASSGLHGRYLTEWLRIMVTGKIIELSHSPDGEETYFLPREHASLLTRKAGSNNMGVYTQEIPLLTSCAMESVSRSFKTGEGIPFSEYPDFQRFMAELVRCKARKGAYQHFSPVC